MNHDDALAQYARDPRNYIRALQEQENIEQVMQAEAEHDTQAAKAAKKKK